MDRKVSKPCNFADPSAVYIFNPGASGSLAAWRLDCTRAPPGNRVAEGEESFKQAWNRLTTCLLLPSNHGCTPVLLRSHPFNRGPAGQEAHGSDVPMHEAGADASASA
jgi:hypothetical protein